MRRVLASVEGQTEEIFIRDVLVPHLWDHGVALQQVILKTKRPAGLPPGRGGVSKWSLIERELKILLADSDAALITTMYDLYGLPADTPGWTRSANENPHQRADNVEMGMRRTFADRRFQPYLQVHEFEALLFAAPDHVEQRAGKSTLSKAISEVSERAGGPELVNDNPQTAPSKRLVSLWPEFTKTLDGPAIVKEAGLTTIRAKCPHFDRWVAALEAVAS